MIHYITTTGIGQAWVGNELRAVKKAGIPFKLHSLRPRYHKFFDSSDIKELEDETNTLYPLSFFDLSISLLAAPFLFRGHFLSALGNMLFSRRESIVVRFKCAWHFLVACCWARSLRNQEVDVIHSQWIHSSGTVGMYAAWLLNVPFGFTGHAADLFRDRCALRDKIKRASYIVCISYFHRDFYLIYGASPDQLIISYCGIDVSKFAYKPPRERGDQPFTIVSSGRLVGKKGFEYLIDACQLLVGRIEFRCVIGGSGELFESLSKRVAELELSEYVSITGKTLLQEDIPEFMGRGDCYCLPCVWASDNDVDGLPQMLMEAMACGLPVISTRLVGIPDLVIDRQTGILLEPNNAAAIADAIENLYLKPELCSELSKTGRQMIVEKFNLQTSVEPLIQEFRKRLPQ